MLIPHIKYTHIPYLQYHIAYIDHTTATPHRIEQSRAEEEEERGRFLYITYRNIDNITQDNINNFDSSTKK